MKVTGKISNVSGETLPGATVFVSDSAGNMLNPPRGVNTDGDGKYSININEGDYITASFVGLKRTTVRPAPIACITTPCPGPVANFMLNISDQANLQVAEITAKKPKPWLLISAVLVASIGITVFLMNYSKIIK